jgi:hypothetical protein
MGRAEFQSTPVDEVAHLKVVRTYWIEGHCARRYFNRYRSIQIRASGAVIPQQNDRDSNDRSAIFCC